MTTQDDGGPARPCKLPSLISVDPVTGEQTHIRCDDWHPGMSLRDYFAAHAPFGETVGKYGQSLKEVNDVDARNRYAWADAMLRARGGE